MSVLVLGATGFIGPHVVAALRSAGEETVGGSRGGGGADGVAVDRRDPNAIRALVRERHVTSVIDLLALTRKETVALLNALDGGIERYVMASSADVYRNYDGLHRRTSHTPVEPPLTEDLPLRPRLHPYRASPRRSLGSADAWMDDYDKIPLERAVRQRAALAGTILRLPMVFGPGDRQRRFRWLLSPMLRSVDCLALDAAWGAWRTSYGYVADVGHALACAAIHPSTRGRTFNLGYPDAPDHRVWIDRFAARLGWRGSIDETRGRSDGRLAGLDLRYPLVLDTRAFRGACAWSEPTALEQALDLTIAHERSSRLQG